jgi:hypothetical protein
VGQLAGAGAGEAGDGDRRAGGGMGFACGLRYASFFGHVQVIDPPEVGPIPQVWFTAIICLGWSGAIGAMASVIISTRPQAVDSPRR